MSADEETTRRVEEARDKHFRPVLADFVARTMESHDGSDWRQRASAVRERLDLQALLKTMRDRWIDVFSNSFEREDREKARDFMFTMLKARNDLAHLETNLDDKVGLRYLDAMQELAGYMKADAVEIAALKRLYNEQRASGVAPPAKPAHATEPMRSDREYEIRLPDFHHFLTTVFRGTRTGKPLAGRSADSYCAYVSIVVARSRH